MDLMHSIRSLNLLHVVMTIETESFNSALPAFNVETNHKAKKKYIVGYISVFNRVENSDSVSPDINKTVGAAGYSAW